MKPETRGSAEAACGAADVPGRLRPAPALPVVNGLTERVGAPAGPWRRRHGGRQAPPVFRQPPRTIP